MSKSHICFDVGSDTLKMAHFTAEGDTLRLEDYAVVNLGIAPDTPIEEHHAVVAQTIRFTLDERKLRPKSILISLSGQSVFVRFVRLPAVEESKIAQIVRYEAQQQVPFPIDEVEWDHQLIGDASGEEIDIVLVAIKTEIVSGLVGAIRKQGLEVEAVDVSALALYNALVFNEGPFETSTALIDLGAKTTNLIIAEGINLWSRSIPIGGDNFTNAIAKELHISIVEATKLKRLVTIGGAPTDDENVRRASDAATAVLTRLLAEIRRSIGYYRSQSQGTPVRRVVISGGGSSIKGITAFLTEKLRVEVTPLSPTAKLCVAPGVNAETLKTQAHLLGDVVGLGLRAADRGLMSVNILPKAVVYQRELSKKKVYIVGAAACLIGALLLLGLHAQASARGARQRLDEFDIKERQWTVCANAIKKVSRERREIEEFAEEIEKMQSARLYWVDFLETIKREKPEYAWVTRIHLEGIEDPGKMLGRSGFDLGLEYPEAGIKPPTRRVRPSSREIIRPPEPGQRTDGEKPRVTLEGYLKITRSVENPEGSLARQVENLRVALEERNKYLGNVVLVAMAPVRATGPRGETLGKFVFEAELDIPIEF